MKIIINYNETDVTEKRAGMIEVECDRHQSPKLPAFIHVVDDKGRHKGYYVSISDTGKPRLSEYKYE